MAKISPKIQAERGVLSEGFNTKGQPAAIAGPILWAYQRTRNQDNRYLNSKRVILYYANNIGIHTARLIGKLKGTIIDINPTGNLSVIPVNPVKWNE